MRKSLLLILTCFQLFSCNNTIKDSEPPKNEDISKINYQEKIDSLKILEIELEKKWVTSKALGEPEEHIDSLSDQLSIVLHLKDSYKMQLRGEFPIMIQTDTNNCGPTCIKMISEHYGIHREIAVFNEIVKLDSNGTTIDKLVAAGRQLNFTSEKHIITYKQLLELNAFPLIIHWNSNHFVVVYKANENKVWVADPVLGHVEYSRSYFCKHWVHLDGPAIGHGKAITFIPNETFYKRGLQLDLDQDLFDKFLTDSTKVD
ncbi:MAG: hypothetical protein GQ574_03400 [Crocinitomix sp.]|nr:hypothetical protein [Crocinitomix sp.]